MVKLIIGTELAAAGKMRVWESTPVQSSSNPDGWGGTNVPKSAVVKIKVTVQYDGSKPYTWEVPGTPDSDFMKGKFFIEAGKLALYTGELCKESDAGAFRSGCMLLKIEMLAPQVLTRYYSNYFIQLPSSLMPGVIVEVKKEGVWTDITMAGSTNSTGWYWEKLNVLDQYTEWRVRIGQTTLDSGMVNREQLTSTGTILAGQLVTVATATRHLFISAAERERWARMVLALFSPKQEATPLPKLPAYSDSGCAEGKLAFIGQQLDFLDDWDKTDCQTGAILLRRIQAQLDQWQDR